MWYVPTHDRLADCRARLAFDLLANTWNPVLLHALRDGPARPADLRRRIGSISPKVLTETLRRLHFNGLVARHPSDGPSARVEYRLTTLGRTLLGPVDAIGAWAFEYGDEVMAAQEAARPPVPLSGPSAPTGYDEQHGGRAGRAVASGPFGGSPRNVRAPQSRVVGNAHPG